MSLNEINYFKGFFYRFCAEHHQSELSKIRSIFPGIDFNSAMQSNQPEPKDWLLYDTGFVLKIKHPDTEVKQFKRNWNKFGIGEPLIFPVKRNGKPEIHLARLLKDFFEIESGKCIFKEFNREILMDWLNNSNKVLEEWTISELRGSTTPGEARNMDPNFGDLYMKIKDADLAQSLKNLLVKYSKCEIDLSKIIGIGGEGTVLKNCLERLNLSLLLLNDS